MKHIFAIILLFPFALHAMENKEIVAQKTCIQVYLATENRYTKSRLYFDPEEIQNPSFVKKASLEVSGATATIKVSEITGTAANVECTMQYMHTNKWAKILPCLNEYHVETVAKTVTVDQNNDNDEKAVIIHFGNPRFSHNTKSSGVVPAGHEYLATLSFMMHKIPLQK
jgi:hypothetical protein